MRREEHPHQRDVPGRCSSPWNRSKVLLARAAEVARRQAVRTAEQ